MSFCTSCGTKIQTGAKFCVNCGTAVDAASTVSNDKTLAPSSDDSAKIAGAEDEYELTELDELCTDAMTQLDDLISNDNIECIHFFNKSREYLFTVKYEFGVIDTVLPEWLANNLTVFVPIDDDDVDVAEKHVYLLPDDFFQFEEDDTGFALLSELFELNDCGKSGDVFCEIVYRNKRGAESSYFMPQA